MRTFGSAEQSTVFRAIDVLGEGDQRLPMVEPEARRRGLMLMVIEDFDHRHAGWGGRLLAGKDVPSSLEYCGTNDRR